MYSIKIKSMGFCLAVICISYCNCVIAAESTHPLGSRITPPQTLSTAPAQNTDPLGAAQGTANLIGPRVIYANDAEVAEIYGPYSAYMASIPFDKRHRELSILVVARAWDSQYEWWAHESGARSAGISDAVIEAIRADRVPIFDKPDEQIIYDYAHEMVTMHRITDETYKKAWDLLGTSMLIKLTMLIGHYCGVAVTLNAHELALPEGVENPLPVK